ncbi:hypothetical protein VTK73DRAFT_7548 [Phialemonium thermophilum]|uniref:Zn(2)-C6 fungal-type domain-containing protein n=1 Tax=Phialemonium thermophilum TaxID=223376 RepID=A0ABR3XS20_9PEZI
MPGILPMKVIKVGNSSQSRIAQACDRCRSKKIRCDGIRPCCSQCANVGFECRTSDKLSRRAFPRGYTESLEERVRQLESEVRELKDLLDEKDEKIDMLSRMHGNNRHASVPPPRASPPCSEKSEPSPQPKEDTFRVQASPLLLGVENSDSYFMGASSGRAFIEALKRKIQETGKPCSDLNPEVFLHIQGCYPLTARPQPAQTMRIPPRIFSDRCVNVFFQEWAPLFPVLHKPTFLRTYEEFVANPEKIKNNHKLVQLYLVFSIAALSGEQPDLEQVAACEMHWQRLLDSIIMENTMLTLQCLVLAIMYCVVRADYKRLQHYKGIAVGLSHRLGLHQSQKRFSFGALTIETRKKVFWTLYTLDCFSAAILGLPKLMKEDDIHTEYPSDTDDEYVTEKGFEACLPGEHTRLSSALALFRMTRILGKVLQTNYPAATSHELSLQQMSSLEADLDEWTEHLPSHLKLNFKQDKPSTDVTGSRSPLLALAYYYTKTLIYRPAVGSSLGPKAGPALLAITEASKHIVQIIELLEERNLSFSFCLNKADTLVLCGMTLLYQSLELKRESRLMKENTKLIRTVLGLVEKAKAPGAYDLKRVAGMVVSIDDQPASSLPTPPQQSPDACMAAPPLRRSPQATSMSHGRSPALGRHAAASVSETDLLANQEKLRRMTMPQLGDAARPALYRVQSRPSLDSGRMDHGARRDHRLSLSQVQAVQAAMIARISPSASSNFRQNFDYLPLDSSRTHSQPSSPVHPRQAQQQNAPPQPRLDESQNYAQLAQKASSASAAEWEALLASLDNGDQNLYDAIYGGPQLALSETAIAAATTSWSPDSWDLTNFNLGDFGAPEASAQSVLSLSDESLSSGDDLAPSEIGLTSASLDFPTSLLPVTPACTTSDGFPLGGLDENFGL